MNNVASLPLYENIEFVDAGSITTGVKSIKGDIARDDLNLDGSGVKIGQIEEARPDVSVTELSDTKITKGGRAVKSNHATLVAAIIAGNTGMVPAAELYSTTYDNFYTNVEWLISSGVSVINMSAYFKEDSDPDGGYGIAARWVDHVVYHHGVSWVNASGNKEDKPVVTPACCYNVIAVGGIDDKGTVSTSDDTFYESSSYKTLDKMPSKPDVVAPAVGLKLSNGYIGTGTSFAAPFVTGMIAQIMSYCPPLKLRPDAIKAAVVASCDRKTSSETLGEITDKEGAGVVNAFEATIIIAVMQIQKTYYETNQKTITFNFRPSGSGKKTIVISWLKKCMGIGSDHSDPSDISSYGFPNFDLYVFDSKGNEVVKSTSHYNSVEMVTFNAKADSNYIVEIRQPSASSEKMSLAIQQP